MKKEINENVDNSVIKMFKNLKKHIGEEVFIKYWYGSQIIETGVLEEVNYFSNVKITGTSIPFICPRAAIVSIDLERTGEKLYFNPYVENEFNMHDDEKIDEIKEKFYGKEIAKMQRDRDNEYFNSMKKVAERSNKEAKKYKYILMKQGAMHVKPEVMAEWLQFVDINTNEAHCITIIIAIVEMMKLFESNVSFDEAIEKVYIEKLGLSESQRDCANYYLFYYAKKGEEYLKYLEQKDEDINRERTKEN